LRNLILFIVRNVHWLLFLVLLAVAVLLLLNNNRLQRSKYLMVTQETAGYLHSTSDAVTSYFNLKGENEALNERVAELESLLLNYRESEPISLTSIGTDSIPEWMNELSTYRFIPARLIYNSISALDNYITLNKGTNDGVAPDMGVFSAEGIVGVVVNASPHFSTVIPVLNSNFRLSCKIKGSNYFGPLVWDGKDPRYAYLQELPRHAEFLPGDTIVTSGYSAVFPEGLPVGIGVESQRQKNDNYNTLKVQLFTDFSTLSNAIIVVNTLKEEQLNLQNPPKDE
jgi:Cell shape-determining protein